MRRFNVYLSDEDFAKVREMAERELRSSKDQMSYLLHLALNPTEKATGKSDPRQAHAGDEREAKPL